MSWDRLKAAAVFFPEAAAFLAARRASLPAEVVFRRSQGCVDLQYVRGGQEKSTPPDPEPGLLRYPSLCLSPYSDREPRAAAGP